jgi:hypothetical protein
VGKEKTKSKEAVAKELKTFVADAKKSPSFAIAILPGDEDPVLLHSRSKKPKDLASKAKTESGSQKIAYGTVTAEGSKLFFKLEDKPPTGLLKAIRSYFKTYGVSAKALVVDQNGVIEGLDDEDGGGAKGGKDDPQRAGFVKAFSEAASKLIPEFSGNDALKKAVEPLIQRMQDLQNAPVFDPGAAQNLVLAVIRISEHRVRAADLKKTFATVVGDMGKRRAELNPGFAKKLQDMGVLVEKAANAIPADIETLVKLVNAAKEIAGNEGTGKNPTEKPKAKTEGSETTDEKAASNLRKLTDAWAESFSALVGRMEIDPGLKPEVEKLGKAYDLVMKKSPPDLSALGKIVLAAGNLVPKPETVKDPQQKGFTEAGQIWTKAADGATLDLRKLRQLILNELAGTGATGDVTNALDGLEGKIGQIRAALANLMDGGAKAGESEARRKQALRVDKLAQQVSQMLKDDEILSQIDDNPFVKVKVAANLGTAVLELRKRLAA